MSAYALPGSMFPDLQSSAGKSPSGPLHSLLMPSTMNQFCPRITQLNNERNYEEDDKKCLGIEVKEAKVDPVRLVQSVIGGSTRSRKPVKRRSFTDLQQQQNTPSSPNGTPTEKAEGKSPHDDAIAFELSISFNGRKYTATRTMQTIVQLRNDLIREMNGRKRWLPNLKQRQPDLSSPSSSSSSEPSSYTEGEKFQIPEIPPIADETGSGGFVGRGFTMLHTVLSSYCPTMERWLRNVTAIVPQDSESLTNFLWEPLSKEEKFDFASSCASLVTLGSIKELEDDECTVEDESEDEWGG
jgi:hypothetical protein